MFLFEHMTDWNISKRSRFGAYHRPYHLHLHRCRCIQKKARSVRVGASQFTVSLQHSTVILSYEYLDRHPCMLVRHRCTRLGKKNWEWNAPYASLMGCGVSPFRKVVFFMDLPRRHIGRAPSPPPPSGSLPWFFYPRGTVWILIMIITIHPSCLSVFKLLCFFSLFSLATARLPNMKNHPITPFSRGSPYGGHWKPFGRWIRSTRNEGKKPLSRVARKCISLSK